MLAISRRLVRPRGATTSPVEPPASMPCSPRSGRARTEALYDTPADDDALDYAALNAVGFGKHDLRAHSRMMWNAAVNDLVARHLAWCDVEVEAKAKNLASRQLADHVRARCG